MIFTFYFIFLTHVISVPLKCRKRQENYWFSKGSPSANEYAQSYNKKSHLHSFLVEYSVSLIRNFKKG